ncbi:MAG TPA: DUF559 domain-containing protein [Microlunatus sp.]
MTSITVPARLDPRVPFSRADARAAGLAEHLLRTPAYQRLFHDTYLCSSVSVTTEMRAAAAISRTGPGAYASHHTAAELWGIPVPIDGLVHVTTAKFEGRNRRRGVLTHQPLTVRGAVTIRHGVRLSRPTQVFCELAAAGVGLVDLVVAGDAMVKKGLATLESLTRSVDRMSGAGVRVARRAVAHVRVGVDSAMESRLRMLLVLAGFPEPEVNVILRNLSGDWSRRFDMCYLALKLIIEYDGEQHGDLDHRDSDIHRREELERLGYTLVQVTSRGIYRDPARTLRRVADALREAGGHVPGRWRPEWRQHFPARTWDKAVA